MTAPQGQARVCPSRRDGADALFAHKVTQAQCQDRQRGQYHKCYTCAYNNAWVQLHGTPKAASSKLAETVETPAVIP